MNKKIIFISILVLIFFIGLIFYESSRYTITSSDEKREIIEKAVQLQDPTICNKINVPILAPVDIQAISEECYRKVAKASKDERICDNLERINSRDNCIRYVNGSLESCGKLIDQFNKGSCYADYVANGRDISLCEKIDDTDRKGKFSGKDICYAWGAKHHKNITICKEKIESEHYRNECFSGVARGMLNQSICEMMEGQYANFNKNRCIESVIEKIYNNTS